MTKLSLQAQAIVDAVKTLYQDEKCAEMGWEMDKSTITVVLRALVSNNEEWVDGTYMVKSEDILNIATELENL